MKKTLSLFILICCTWGAIAQQALNRIGFEHLTVANGLSDNEVLAMIQDHLGFIWMGTLNGLVSYDGSTVATFQYNPSNPNSLKANVIVALHEDANGDIWIGSSTLIRFERATKRFYEYPNTNLKKKDPSVFISFIHEDKQGCIWTVSINSGDTRPVDRFNPKTNTWTSFRHDPKDPESLASDLVYAEFCNRFGLDRYGFVEDTSGKIWTTNWGGPENTLHWFDPKKDKFIRYKPALTYEMAADFKKLGGIANDRKGNLYISTFGGGLFCLNPANGKMIHYKHDPFNNSTLMCDTMVTVYADKQGFVWIPTKRGMDRLEPVSGTFRHYFFSPGDTQGMSAGFLKNPAETPDGNIWYISRDGLNCYDHKIDRFISYTLNTALPEGLAPSPVNAIMIDRTGLLWAASGEGVSKESRIVKFPFMTKIPGNSNGPLDSTVVTIYEAPSEPGITWFGTVAGLDRYDKKAGTWTHYQHEERRKNSLVKGMVTDIVEDKAGRLWVSTVGGLSLMDRKKGTFVTFSHDPANANSLQYQRINCLKAASDGKLWIGTQTGLDCFEYDKKKYTHYVKTDTSYTPGLFDLVDKFSTSDRRVAEILRPGNNADKSVSFSISEPGEFLVTALGNLFVAKSDYGWIEDGGGKIIWEMNKEYTRSDGSGSIRVGTIRLETGKYRLRYKTDDTYSYGNWNLVPPYHPELYGIQVLRVDAAEARIIDAESAKRYINCLGDNIVRGLTEDKDKNIWIGTIYGGVTRLEPVTGRFTVFSDPLTGPADVMGSIVEDNRTGNLWVGDYLLGLLLMDKNGKILKRYDNSNGLPSNSIRSILQDSKGLLWIGTNNGLCRLDPVSGQSQLYDRQNGLKDLSFNYCASGKCADGEMYFAGETGVISFYPEKINKDRIAPSVVLTDMDIAGKPATLGKDGLMAFHIAMGVHASFTYDRNDLTFHYTAIQFNRGNDCRFAYRLLPNDKEWTQAGMVREVRYTNLGPGRYTFFVKAANADGVWNEKGTSFSFIILPPIWKTWWAYCLYIILLTGTIWYYIKSREKVLKERQKNLEDTVVKRTAEVVVQKERAEQSEKFKQQFLANMSHEIRCPHSEPCVWFEHRY